MQANVVVHEHVGQTPAVAPKISHVLQSPVLT